MTDLNQTARGLRKSVGTTAITLPILLLLIAGPQDSISATYYTAGRNSLVGALGLIAGFLWCYAGIDWRDRWAGRAASIAAALIASCPTAPANPVGWDRWIGAVHGLSALVFFGALAYFCWQLFPRGASLRRARFYRFCACVIVFGIVVSAWGIIAVAPGAYTFWLEAMSIWAFGTAWFVHGTQE